MFRGMTKGYSLQTCSCCGFKGGKKELSIREWTCLNCGTIHDRDINASAISHGQENKLRISAIIMQN